MPSSSQPRFGVTSLHGASGPGSVRSAPRMPHDHEADERGQGDGEPVGAGVRDAEQRQDDAGDDAHHAVAAHDHGRRS